MQRQGRALNALIERRIGSGPKRVLDCTCGIGTPARGLSALGYQVLGTDLSEAAVSRATEAALARGLGAEFRVCDVRSLESLEGGPFDVVLSADNSLSHLMTSDEVLEVARGWNEGTDRCEGCGGCHDAGLRCIGSSGSFDSGAAGIWRAGPWSSRDHPTLGLGRRRASLQSRAHHSDGDRRRVSNVESLLQMPGSDADGSRAVLRRGRSIKRRVVGVRGLWILPADHVGELA